MVIREMSREESLQVLAKARLVRLACAHENQPYVVPVYLAFNQPAGDEACLYGFTTPGQKVLWMRANPLVCVEVDEVAAFDQWVSVIAMGRYEELLKTAGVDGECGDAEWQRAWQILKTHSGWEEPGCSAWAARAHCDPPESLISVYYKIHIDHVTGHKATRDIRDGIAHTMPAPPMTRWGWLRRKVTRVFSGRSQEAGSAS